MSFFSPVNQARWALSPQPSRLLVAVAVLILFLCSRRRAAGQRPPAAGAVPGPAVRPGVKTTLSKPSAARSPPPPTIRIRLQHQLATHGWALWPPVRFGATTINFASTVPFPSPPSASNWLGTDANGGDVLARILYGTRISVLFGLLLTLFSSVLGVLAGAIQGYYGGKIDLWGQRFIEVWSGMPTLFLIILLSSVVQPGFWWLLAITVLFGWMTLVGVVRAEFLRTRNYDYVRAAQALGVSDRQIILRHMLPNAMVATLTFLPFILCSSITTLTSLDFLGFGLPLGSPSLGELLLQGKTTCRRPAGHCRVFSVAVLLTLLILLVKRFATPLIPVRRCNMTHPLLAIDNLSIAFRQQGETQTVVHNLSLEVAVGETLAGGRIRLR